MKQRARFLVFLLLVTIGGAVRRAEAVDLDVNCDGHPQGPNTIIVSGECKETLVIQSMDRLTLITKKGASITDPSGGTLAVVDIENSQRVTLQGFTINGGAQGILCSTASLCYLTGNTIQGPGRFGINVIKGSRAFLESNVIEDWG